jgi:hypothetical protein
MIPMATDLVGSAPTPRSVTPEGSFAEMAGDKTGQRPGKLLEGLFLFLGVLILGCQHAVPDSNWSAWFSNEVRRLPAWSSPQSLGAEVIPAQTPDGVSFRLPVEYRKRNDFGCWSKSQSAHPTSEWRDLCVHLVSLGKDSLPGFLLRASQADPHARDLYKHDAWEAGTMLLGSRRAIVERARVSGGIEGLSGVRAIAVLIEINPHGLVILEGRVGEDRGYDEILRVAATVGLVRQNPERM